MEKTKICPKCRTPYPNTSEIKYCIVCGHRFESISDNPGKVFEDLFGFDIKEGLNRND